MIQQFHINELSADIQDHLLMKHVLNSALNSYSKPSTRVPPRLVNEELQKIYKDKAPRHGQEITITRLHMYDSLLIPSYREYVARVFHTFSSPPRAQALRKNALKHAAAISNAPDVDDLHLGTRHMLKYIQNSNSTICTLRAVCRSYAAMFNDFVFRPFVDLDDADETVSVHQNGNPALRGAVPRGVRFTHKAQTLHVYFARKSITFDSKTGDPTVSWQYLNPLIAKIGCDAIVVKCETEPDESGRVFTFNASQPRQPWLGCNVTTAERDWRNPPSPPTSFHSLQPESLANESFYSLHAGTEWTNRISQADQGRLVCLWDEKFDHRLKHLGVGLFVANSQSFLIPAKCPKTSASYTIGSSSPLIGIRFIVSIGRIKRGGEVSALETITQLSPEEMSSFSSVVSGVSEYFYSSAVPLDPAAVAKRALKRKNRTVLERSAKSN